MEMLEGGGLGPTQGRGVLTGLGTSAPTPLPPPPASLRPSSSDVQSAGGGSEVSARTGIACPGRAPPAGPPLRTRWRWLLRSFACVSVSKGRLKGGKGKDWGQARSRAAGEATQKAATSPRPSVFSSPTRHRTTQWCSMHTRCAASTPRRPTFLGPGQCILFVCFPGRTQRHRGHSPDSGTPPHGRP